MSEDKSKKPLDFVRAIVEEDLASGKHESIVTRFPPEPNGYLHIGHAKAICIDFGIAKEYGGRCHLRFDDTNPTKEEVEYVESIQEDVQWLGWQWDEIYWASNYFGKMYKLACQLVKDGKAYVDDQTPEQISENRGTLTDPGKDSPYRNRSVEENLDLFQRMKNGEFPDGSKVLRAKIDMASPNINLRDPIMYRVVHAEHHNTGSDWCVYPMYDWAHGLEDSIEGVTHSLCTLEFENHRPLYEWFLQQLPELHQPRQIEFSRLNLSYTVMSKRKLLQLVKEDHVDGWDDPRMPTICGLRRRGYTAEAIRALCDTVGITKINGITDIALLEHHLRDDLNKRAARYMGVMEPLKVVLTNYPEGSTEELAAVNNPEDESMGTRIVPFSRELYIERDDFMEEPPKKFFRLKPGGEVRLRYGYFIKCEEVIKDAEGNVVELRCTYDPETRGGNASDGRKVKGTIHWVSAAHAVDAEVRVYDRLFTVESPDAVKEKPFLEFLNPDSLRTVIAKVEPTVAALAAETCFQFERTGYFVADRYDHSAEKPVLNRSVPLRDSWAKIQKKEQPPRKEDASARQPKDGANVVDLIDIAQFFKAELKTARVLECENVEGADRLLKLQVQAGDEKRQIVAGIAKWYKPDQLVGKNVVILANLKPATIFGIESQGMLLAAKHGKKRKERLTILTTDDSDFADGANVG